MTGVYSILGFVAKLGAIEAEMHTVNHAIVARACELICAEAKRVIGTYDYGWPQLSPKTLEHKFFNTPLLETGAMRASIEWHAEGNSGEVGSNSDIAVFQELGTSKIPPRPFLAGAAQHMEDKIHRMAAKAVVACIAGRGLHSSEMAELMHLLHTLHHVGHAVGEAVDKALEPDDNEKKRR